MSSVSSKGSGGCPESTRLPLVSRDSCSQELADLSSPCVLCCLGFLFLLLAGLMEERFEKKT